MTGLNPDSDEILEVFCFITTANLEIIDPTGFGVVVHVPTERLDEMDDWCTNTHTTTGLWDQVVASTTTAEEAAASLLAYIQKWVPEPNTALLAGNSVHADRAFLRKGPWAPVVEYLKYRIMDISTIKEAALRWSPPEVSQNAPQKTGLHRAKEDILDSIREAKYYKDVIFSRGE
ncbi:Phosphatidylinositol 3,4,5-trisphosphate-dependent Rac exchanger 2 protein [Ceratocystis pirilliformis]|uniref:Phosphatidylinositol 3,4,5-trisphosphate-dependent Rac exchanger 2 protein n=1 Tax=Ceratocystis pirilliformis TaxID=259994 RepID=A0ABR3YSZ8_9PEZI